MKNLQTAIIDIGSNTVRLVMYRYSPEEGLREIGNMKKVARLRTYLLPSGEMSKEGIEMLSNLLTSFKEILQDYEITDVKIAATAAIRQATNREEVVELMTQQLGMTIDILSEEEEAYFGFLAVVNSMATQSALTIDIGGGSTELTLFKDKKLYKTFSFPFGTVSLKQQFVTQTEMSEEEKQRLRQYVIAQFQTLPWVVGANLPLIAIGGSARNIAQVHQQKVDYPLSDVHQYEMTKADVDQLTEELGHMTLEQLKELNGLASDRADIIVLALEVFASLMTVSNAPLFLVCKKGLREGLIINTVAMTNKSAFDKNDVFHQYVKHLAFTYGRSEEVSYNLCMLASQLYSEACKLNVIQFNQEHLKWLECAAKLFSIGEYIELDSRSEHTFYLIANQSILGLTQKERIQLALLASYKNKEYFDRFIEPFASWFTKDEQKTLKDLGSLLKFIFALNISKRNNVEHIQLKEANGTIIAEISARNNAIAEQYEANKRKKQLERLFKHPVQIQFNTTVNENA